MIKLLKLLKEIQVDNEDELLMNFKFGEPKRTIPYSEEIDLKLRKEGIPIWKSDKGNIIIPNSQQIAHAVSIIRNSI